MRKKSFLTTIGTPIILMLLMAIPVIVSGQNYVVNSNLDAPAANLITGETATPGQITLRSAVQAATAQPGAHIITFSGAVVSPINLTLGQMTLGNAAAGNNITITGPGMNLLTVNQTTDNRIFSTGTGAVTVVIQNITLNNLGPGVTPYSGGGGAIIAGGAGASTTLTNVTISNFDSQIGNGGAISQSSSLNVHTLTITNCVFTNNRCGGAGGAVSFNSQGGTATITGCTFTNNHTGPVGANTGGDGGAVNLSGGGAGGTYLVERNTFLNNQAENPGGHAGAIMSTNGTATIRFNRFIGNTCLNTTNPPLANVIGQAGGATTHVTIADNNWWGVNTGPGPNDATALNAGAVMTLTKWLQLKTTASPNPICNTPAGLGNTTTVTTSFLSNSASEAIAVGNVSVLIGLPVTWGPTTLGSLSGQQATIQASGTATATFTSNGTGGTATVNTQVDNVPAGEVSPARANITVNTIPIVTDPANFTSCVGGTATFTSTITGTPAPLIEWRIGTTVLVNGLQGSGSTVSGQGTATLTITNVQPGDASANYNVRASNQCGIDISANATLTVNQVTGGTVAADQTICSGGDPAAFTETVASTGSGTLTYQWQSSTTSCAAGFSNIAGATGTTYDPPSGVTVTTYYRRVTTSTLNAVPCTANSNCITVTVNNVTGGTVAADQTICSGGDPAAFTQTVASTGSGVLTYQWQSSTTSCAAGFSNIAGATGTTYDPPSGLTVTTFYRRIATSTLNAVPCTAISNCLTVTINDVTGGTVGSDQTVCSGGDPAAFTQTVASTGSGVLNYQWQSSTTSCAAGFSNIAGATASTYDPPTGLAVTTYYRRVTTSTLNAVPCTANSNCITVTINSVTGGTVAADQTLCTGGDPTAFTESAASTGSGTLTYQWQSSTTSCAAGFSDISGATGTTYDPPSGLAVTTYYRRVTTSTLNAVPCTANSNCITITINDVTGGIVGSDQSVCPGGDPAAFTQSVASTGSGALTYQWQSSTTSCVAGFSNIAGATGTTYDPPSGLTVTTFYRRITTSTLNAVPCTANSNCITVTVNPINTITLTSAAGTDNQTVLVNTPITNITYATTGATGATFSGLPTGVTGNWAGNVVTISGTPTVAGLFNYTVTLTGGCGVVTATGTINVIVCSITLTSAAGTDAQSVCINTPITTITYGTTGATGATFSGLPTGVTGNWAADVVTISGTPTVNGVFNYTVTPTGGGCTGAVTATGTITISLVPDAIATPSSQSICSGAAIQTIVISGSVGGTVFNWTRDNTGTVTGIAASGSGDISGALTNTTTSPVTVTFTITPTQPGCPGTPITATVIVNPTPDAVATPASQTICSGGTITTIVLSGAVGSTTFNWTRDNTGTVTGIAASGSGDINGTLTNTTTSPVTVTFTITPTANSCPGAPITATVTVNPIPDVTDPADQTVCNNANTAAVVFTGSVPGTTYSWTNSDPSIGLAASGTGDIASFTALNATNAPVTATITVTPVYGTAGPTPELIHYKFDGSGTSVPNLASAPPAGTATGTLLGSLTQGGTAICDGTLIGSGNASSTDYVNTGWAPNLGTGSWTISFKSENITPSATLFYVFGDINSSGFRCFTNGIAGPNNWVIRGAGLTDTYINGGATVAPHTNTFVYDNALNQVRAYLDGVLVSTVAQGAVNLTGSGPFKFNGYSTNVGSPLNGHYDEFRIYNRALSPAEVSQLSNCGTACTGTPQTFTITVNPTPSVNAVADVAVCGGATVTVPFTGSVAGTTYNWTNNNTAIGLAASGSGDLNFTATNNTPAPISGTITVTPVFGTCSGTPITFTITVAGQPSITSVTNDDVCEPGGVVNLAATGNGTINWYDAPTLGNLVNTGNTYSPNITTTTTYYVESITAFTGPSQSISLPSQSGTNSPNVRGYYFTAPTNFVITSLEVPTDASSGNQSIAVVKFDGNVPPPAFSATTNAFTTLYLTQNNPAAGSIPVSILINAGEVIGIYGYRGTTNSYGTAAPIIIDGNSVPIARTGMQFPLTTTAPQDLWSESSSSNISRVFFEYALVTSTCTSSPRVPVTGTVNQLPVATATPSSQTVCSGPITTIVLSSTEPGTTYAWTRDNTVNVTGIPANGTGDISGTLTNNTTVPQTVTFTITPTSGAGCVGTSITATVTVQAVPTITCPANITQNNDPNQCGAIVTYSPTITGIPVPTVTYTFTGATTASGAGDGSGSTFNVGITTVNIVATNACGSANCTFTVTVNDTQNPTITCPAPVTVSCAAAVPAPAPGSVAAADNCPGVVVTHISDVISNQTCLNRYTITRTYRATDASGNFVECTQIITVNDQTPPVLTCPANVTVSCASAVPAPNIASVTGVSDNCAGVVTVTHQGDVISNQTCTNRFTITRTYRATDVCGNFAECTQIITVNDQTPPTLTCPAAVTVSCAAAVPAPNIASVTGVSDNCAGVVTVTHQGDVISNQTCANRFTITRTYRATDVCGNFAECTQIITVNDVTPPVITCPAPVTVSCASAVPAVNIASVTATDNCAGVITITHISDVISNQTCANRFTLTRTYRATDVCGNFSQCTQIITVNDQTAPVITCPANITVNTGVGTCVAIVNFNVTATDNCGAVTVVSVPASGSAFPIGTTTVTSTATDACGMTAVCTFTVTVNDVQLPVITTQPVNRTICVGSSTSFSVTAITAPSAGGPLAYQWQTFNGSTWVDIAGATSATYTLNNVPHSLNATSYRVRIAGLCTTIFSNHAILTVNPLPAVSISLSNPPIVNPVHTVTITATASPLGGTYVWLKNNVIIPGATGNTLGPLGVFDVGFYKVIYTDLNGCSRTSNEVEVRATPSLHLWVYPNPNNGTFHVRFYNVPNEQMTVQVFSSAGQLVFRKAVLTTLSYTDIVINLGENSRLIMPGVYIVELLNSNGQRVGTKQIIVHSPH